MTNFHSFPGIFRPWSGTSHGGSGLIEPSTQNSITGDDSVEHSGHLPLPERELSGNCAQYSTELTPMIECCVQGSIHPEIARVEPLLEQDPRCER